MKTLIPQDSEQYRFECEIREWKRLAKLKGRSWWNVTKNKIKAKRGQAGLDKLLNAMNGVK
jgi:hypothetical protein